MYPCPMLGTEGPSGQMGRLRPREGKKLPKVTQWVARFFQNNVFYPP